MFENFENAKHTKMPAWAMPLIIASVAIHLIVFTGMWVKAMWAIDKLEVPKGEIGIALAAPPPPPPAPPAGGKKPEAPKEKKIRKVKVQEPVQPVQQLEDKPEEVSTNDVVDPDGVGEGGDSNGVPDGDPDGVPQALPPPPPPPPPAAPRNIAPTALEAQRIGGEKNILPDDVTKTEIQRAGKTKIVTSVKICLSATGSVATLNVIKASGFPAYDQKIQREMRNWKYRPFMVNGKAAPVCTAVTFIYQQKS
jgi:periplasmic protein TonB